MVTMQPAFNCKLHLQDFWLFSSDNNVRLLSDLSGDLSGCTCWRHFEHLLKMSNFECYFWWYFIWQSNALRPTGRPCSMLKCVNSSYNQADKCWKVERGWTIFEQLFQTFQSHWNTSLKPSAVALQVTPFYILLIGSNLCNKLLLQCWNTPG